ncbi:hypothetical protein BT93_L5893 [Corymbia citriodora subsp. variegata]|uniref:EF-hand domain-containing protein n=1 Tax=Corymbia citriodora subsp. variegata TaxID=360336 RepID=A0A8T0CR25_CORYI|nr:hypothetical protein BT93_L5893 [Corymbia citriodora subsp. variegata]
MENVSDANATMAARVVSPRSAKVREAASDAREAASDCLQNLTEEQKEAAKTFFENMDEDGDGSISVDEFTAFLSHAGFQNVNPDELFKDLDKDKNGTLNFEELVTFFYNLSRNENKQLLTGRPSSEVPGPKAKINAGIAGGAKAQEKISHGTAGGAKAQAKISSGMTGETAQAEIIPGMTRESAQGWRGKIPFLKGLFNKLQEMFGLKEWVKENVSTIV